MIFTSDTAHTHTQTQARCDTAGAGVDDNVWKILTYRLVGVKDKTSKGKDHFDGKYEIDLLNLVSKDPFRKNSAVAPTLSKILSEDSPQGKAFLQERLDPSSETWRQFFFKTLDKMSTRLDIYDAEMAMPMQEICVKMIMPEPTPFLPEDFEENLKLSVSPSEERRVKISDAAAKCRRLLALTGDISLCPLFSGTRADVYEHLDSDQSVQVDSNVVEIRRPYVVFELVFEREARESHFHYSLTHNSLTHNSLTHNTHLSSSA